ncbi:MAG: hypothetical protein N7Q72_04305, partial [Spiroplasma sp. Tabriz.8]|nr:hypothetical protein [Spiroplasma sp. Tabriz.8]
TNALYVCLWARLYLLLFSSNWLRECLMSICVCLYIYIYIYIYGDRFNRLLFLKNITSIYQI